MDNLVTLITSRLDSIDRTMHEDRREAAESRKQVYDKLEEQSSHIALIGSRVQTLEKAIVDMSPTVAEFVTMKAQVQGAGKLGTGLWTIGSWVLTAAVGFVSAWAWLQGFFSNTPK